MTLDELAALPVQRLAHPEGCALLVWTTGPKLLDTKVLLDAWGFRYVTIAFVWVKRNKDSSRGGLTGTMGYYTRPNIEPVLLGIRRKAPPILSHSVEQVIDGYFPHLWDEDFEPPFELDDPIVAVRRAHSRKPDEQYDRIERLFAGPYLEMFARGPHSHSWDSWGNQAEEKEIAA